MVILTLYVPTVLFVLRFGCFVYVELATDLQSQT